nr:membrane protein [Myxococcus sp. MH1]
MSWSRGIRQTHRWLSVAFTVAVIANIVVMGQESPPIWVAYLALPPLLLLLLTGLYLFVLPYRGRARGEARHSD